MLGMQPTHAPAHCSSPQPPPQPLEVPGVRGAGVGAHQYPRAGREVRVLPAPHTALPWCFLFFCQPEAACVSGCFRAALWRRCAGPPTFTPTAGSRGTSGSSFLGAGERPCCHRSWGSPWPHEL